MWLTASLQPGQHDELADFIKEDVWPNPAKYFTGAGLSDVSGRVFVVLWLAVERVCLRV